MRAVRLVRRAEDDFEANMTCCDTYGWIIDVGSAFAFERTDRL